MPSKSPNGLQAIIFDLDETLIDWSGALGDWRMATRPNMQRVHSHLTAEGHELPSLDTFVDYMSDIFRQTWIAARETLVAPFLPDMWRAAMIGLGLDASSFDVSVLLRVYDWTPIDGVAAYPDAIPVLTALRRSGYKIGLLTNSSAPMWMRDIELQAYGLLPYLDARITSGETGFIKPHPAVFNRIAALLSVPVERALFVGDSLDQDIAGANGVGMTSVWMNPPHLAAELNGVLPDYEIARLEELLPIVAALERS